MENSPLTSSSMIGKFNLTSEDCNRQVEDHFLQAISQKHGIKWKLLRPHLGLPPAVDDDIDRDGHNEEEKRYTFLIEWKKRKGAEATYKALITALEKIDSKSHAEFVCQLLQETLAHTHDGYFKMGKSIQVKLLHAFRA